MAKSATAGRTKAKSARKSREDTESSAVENKPVAKASPVDRSASEDAERSLGRLISRVLPIGTVVIALAVGFSASLGPALLVLAAGTLLGTIALFWASVRTLGGDAPLPADLEAIAARRHGVDELAEKKSQILRALKDLEHEHAVGKIEDADYEEIASRYREQAKDVMREMDADLEPLRERAEQIARAHLKKRGLDDIAETPIEQSESDDADEEEDGSDQVAPTSEPKEDIVDAASARRTCAKCSTSNEPDATFCKKCGASLEKPANDAATKDGDASA